MPRRRRNPEFWRVAPLLPGSAAIFGVVADDVIGARVTVGTLTAQVDARENLIAGVLPFPHQDGVRVDLIRRTAPWCSSRPPRRWRRSRTGGPADPRAGDERLGEIVPRIKSQRRTVGYGALVKPRWMRPAGIAKLEPLPR
jgi:hypothetical protein